MKLSLLLLLVALAAGCSTTQPERTIKLQFPPVEYVK
jgi:hypothetical protein